MRVYGRHIIVILNRTSYTALLFRCVFLLVAFFAADSIQLDGIKRKFDSAE